MEISFSQFFENKSCEQLMTATAHPVSNQFSHNFARGVLQVSDSVQLLLSLVLLVCRHARPNYWGASVAIKQRRGTKSFTWTAIPFSRSVQSIPTSPGQHSKYSQSPQTCLPIPVRWDEQKLRACVLHSARNLCYACFLLPAPQWKSLELRVGKWEIGGDEAGKTGELTNFQTLSQVRLKLFLKLAFTFHCYSSLPSIKGLILVFNIRSQKFAFFRFFEFWD